MPSNQCTNSLMELSFAIGNMFGAAECVKDDYRQLKDIINAWECSKRGKVKDELAIMTSVIDKAIARGGARGKAVPVAFCQELWYSHNRLVNTMNIFDDEGVGLGARGPVPPVVKGPDGVAVTRSLEEMRGAWPDQPPKTTTDEEPPAAGEEPPGNHYARPSRGMEYGDEERRKRWYPARV
jgi:hypothetical protein